MEEKIETNVIHHEEYHEDTMHHIIWCLEFLQKVAREEGEEDIAELINSAFQMCLRTYCIVKRTDLADILEKKLSESIVHVSK